MPLLSSACNPWHLARLKELTALALKKTCVQCPGRHLNGFADRPPVRPNISLGDTLAGLHAALGISMALLHRQTHNKQVPGQVGCLGSRL